MARKKKKANNDLQIGGNVSVTRGDFVAGNKNIKIDRGGVFVRGDVQDSNIVTGNHNQVNNKEISREVLFAEIIKKIEQRPNTAPEDKEDLKASVEEIKAEAEKGGQAGESFLERRLRNIKRVAPDIAEVVLATLSNPAAGFAAIIKRIAARAQKSTSG